MSKIVCIVGTRPEAIKMAPVIRGLKMQDGVECRVIATAQHRELMDDVFTLFGIVPDIDLEIMRPNQGLTELTSRCLVKLNDWIVRLKPDAVLAQGDTTTVMTAAMASFYNKIPFGHIEAGLRSGHKYNPFPEEMNRIVAGHMAHWHFAPTERARNNLLAEGISDEHIFVTGNTVIDALLEVASNVYDISLPVDASKKLVLVTAHRRENFGEAFSGMCRALRQLADIHHDINVLYPVHPNPNVRNVAYQLLGDHPNIVLCDPLNYREFVAAMKRSCLILTDSGGVQEEAPALGVPVLVLRNTTERPEAVDCGAARLVGTEPRTIVEEASRVLTDPQVHQEMAIGASPYGDGKAAERIVSIVISGLEDLGAVA